MSTLVICFQSGDNHRWVAGGSGALSDDLHQNSRTLY